LRLQAAFRGRRDLFWIDKLEVWQVEYDMGFHVLHKLICGVVKLIEFESINLIRFFEDDWGLICFGLNPQKRGPGAGAVGMKDGTVLLVVGGGCLGGWLAMLYIDR